MLEQLKAQLQNLAAQYKTLRAELVADGLLDNEKPQIPNPTDLQVKLKQYQTTLLPKLKLLGSPTVPSFSDEEKAFLEDLYQNCQAFLSAFPKLNEVIKTKLQSLLAPAQAAAQTFENFQNGLFKKEGGGDSVGSKPTKAGSGQPQKGNPLAIKAANLYAAVQKGEIDCAKLTAYLKEYEASSAEDKQSVNPAHQQTIIDTSCTHCNKNSSADAQKLITRIDKTKKTYSYVLSDGTERVNEFTFWNALQHIKKTAASSTQICEEADYINSRLQCLMRSR